MRNFRQRKAFTIVEMVIVIAVIAVLAAVMIPTISGVIKKANHSADTQFAASLSMQLATWEADPANGVIDSEEKLREAMEAFYDADFYDTLAPKSGKDGYHYWYDVESKKVILATYAELAGEIETYATGELTFSPANPRSLLISNKNYFLLDKSGSEFGEMFNSLEALDRPQVYEELINDMAESEDPLVKCLYDKIKYTTIVTEAGAFRCSEASEIKHVYIPKDVTELRETFVYVYADGTVSDNPVSEVSGNNVSFIIIPAGVTTIGQNVLSGVYKDTTDTTNYTDQTALLVQAKNAGDLAKIFSSNVMDTVVQLPSGERFLVDGGKIYSLPLERDDTGNITSDPASDELKEVPGETISVNLTCPNASTTPSAEALYINDKNLYIAYTHINQSIELKVEGYSANRFSWTVTTAEDEETDVLTIENGVLTVKNKINVGDNNSFKVTATYLNNAESKDVINVTLVRPTFVNFDLNGTFNYDTFLENNKGIELSYKGANADNNYAITNVEVNNSYFVKLDNATAANVTFSTEGNLFTVNGTTVIVNAPADGAFSATQNLIVKLGDHLTFEVPITVKNEADAPFVLNTAQGVEIGSTYLFRIGNLNAFALGNLYNKEQTDAKLNKGSVDVQIWYNASIDGEVLIYSTKDADKAQLETGTPLTVETYTSGATWDVTTIKFKGTGVAKIVLLDQYNRAKELWVEVVSATNVTAYSELKNQDSVLLNNIEITAGGQYYMSNVTLYGNGYTFNVKGGRTKGENLAANYLVSLNNSTLDNVKIVGDVYTQYGGLTSKDYNNALVYVTGESYIYNCYLSNCTAPVRMNEANLTIKDTTLKGGAFANIDIRNGVLTLKGTVTTINQADLNDTEQVGMGIMVYYEAVKNTTKINIEGDLIQYNFISEDDTMAKVDGIDYNKYLKQEMFKHSDYYFVDGEKYIHTGIASMMGTFTTKNIEGSVEHYLAKDNIDCYGNTGAAYAIKSTDGAKMMAEVPETYTWAPNGHGIIVPKATFDTKSWVSTANGNDWKLYQNNRVDISMDKGDSVTWNPNILTVKKAEQGIAITSVTINGTEYKGKSVTFGAGGLGAGEYTIVYKYIDPLNYDKDGNYFEVEYTKELTVVIAEVEASAKNAEFAFENGYPSKKVTVGSATHIVLDITESDIAGTDTQFGATLYKTTNGTLVYKSGSYYYPATPIVMSDGKTSHSSGWYAQFPVFKNVISITDYANKGLGDAVTYDASTTTMPSNLSEANPTSTFIYSSATKADASPSAVNKVLYYKSAKIEANRNAMVVKATYTYTDNKGASYTYYVGYYAPSQTYSNTCVTSDTLVTLANGTQVRVDSLTGNELLRVWDHTTGTITYAPIAYIVNHDETVSEHNVLKMAFSDGNYLEIIGEHVFYDKTLNKYIAITVDNVNEYIGHVFVSNEGDGLKEVTLVGAENIVRNTGVYEVVTYKAITCFTNGILSASAYLDPLLNVFDMDADTMVYDEAKMLEDIATYGLYTFEDFEGLVPEEAFEMYNAAYLKIAVGKGYITWDDILALIDIYYNNDVTPLQ